MSASAAPGSALGDPDQHHRCDHRHDEPQDVELEDVSGPQQVRDHASDDRADEAEKQRYEDAQVLTVPGLMRRASAPMMSPATMKPITSKSPLFLSLISPPKRAPGRTLLH